MIDLGQSQRRRIAARAILHFDLDDREGVRPALGFEYPLARRPQVRGTIREAAWFEQLVGCGACDVGKRDALLHWPGCSIDTQLLEPRTT